MYQGADGPHYVLLPESQRGNLISKWPNYLEKVFFQDFNEPLLNCLKHMTHLVNPVVPPLISESISVPEPEPLPVVPPLISESISVPEPKPLPFVSPLISESISVPEPKPLPVVPPLISESISVPEPEPLPVVPPLISESISVPEPEPLPDNASETKTDRGFSSLKWVAIFCIVILITIGGYGAIERTALDPKIVPDAKIPESQQPKKPPLPEPEINIKTPPSPLPDIRQSVKSLTVAMKQEQLIALQKLAGEGDVKMQLYLGQMYALAKGVSQDNTLAFKWLQAAANQGNAEAQYNLGVMYDTGQGVVQNDAKAVLWYQKAADQGYASAQANLGIMYFNGQGVVQNKVTALTWFQKAAKQGHNLDKVCRVYQEDAEQGQVEAKQALDKLQCQKN